MKQYEENIHCRHAVNAAVRLLFITIQINIIVLSCSARCGAEVRPSPSECTYDMQTWNTDRKDSVMKKKVRHSYAELTPEEIDPATGCTVCSEDQEVISVPPLRKFSVCYKIAPRVRSVFACLARNNAPIHTVVGYHAIKSRGPLDAAGNRTGFSNHSYGTAIDINPEQNGLYDNCIQFGPECHLLRGGEWHPGTPGALEKNCNVVSSLKQEGFHWGGEIAGRQKDFMHFSLTGY
jgi:hypothetical protein